MRHLEGWLRSVRLWLRVGLSLIRPEDITHEPPGPNGDHVHSLISHQHRWDRCRWNGQYWYARCVAYEWCTARIAC